MRGTFAASPYLRRLRTTLGADIAHVFGAILTVCDRQGLIRRELFAIDGVKMPCKHAALPSGKRADFERQSE